jgi:hypothetical protein
LASRDRGGEIALLLLPEFLGHDADGLAAFPLCLY